MSEFGDKARTIAVIGRRSRPRVQEGHDAHGRPFKAVTDGLGHTTTEWDDHQDVTIRAQPVSVTATIED